MTSSRIIGWVLASVVLAGCSVAPTNYSRYYAGDSCQNESGEIRVIFDSERKVIYIDQDHDGLYGDVEIRLYPIAEMIPELDLIPSLR